MTRSRLPLASAMRRGLLLAVAWAALLAGLGLAAFPSTLADWRNALLGLTGVGLVLVVYAILGTWGSARLDTRLLRLSLVFGLMAGAVYATEIALEYILLPLDNTAYGVVEFGLVFLVYFVAGAVAARQTRRARDGALAALGAALLSTVLWYIVLLAITYAMRGTPQQAAVFRAEGNYDDFARSASVDFQAWVMEDLLGAGFYHLLLGPIIAVVLGAVGGVLGKALTLR